MNLFVNDIPVTILESGRKPDKGHFDKTLDARKSGITKAALINHIWVTHAEIQDLDTILDLINSKVPIKLLSLFISVDNYPGVQLFLKGKFKIIRAAGGLVKKKERFLMIYRQKKWDLAKGKKESGESSRDTAVREVEEECNVRVNLGPKICTTWHTYTMNRKAMLKRTRWYLMELLDDSRMKPRREEDIEDIRWMTEKEVYHALENSYNSIRFVFEEYYRKSEKVG